MQLLNGTTPETTANYNYDVMNRIETVDDGTNMATYLRIPGTDMLDTSTVKNISTGNTLLLVDRDYDQYKRLTSIASTPTGQAAKAHSYVYNDKDQRTKLTLPDGSYWIYSYDDKGQVIGGIKYNSTGNALPGQGFGYDYDGIGNRNWASNGLGASTAAGSNPPEGSAVYTANNLNQYTQIEMPGVLPVTGEADADTTVKVIRNDAGAAGSGEQVVEASRDGKYFTAMFKNVNNIAGAVTIPFTVYAIKEDTANNKQLIQKASGSYNVPKRDQTFTYDADGNLLSDGKWTYTYNAENRLIELTTKNSNDTKLEFKYDYDGRRVSKKIYSWNTDHWVLAQELKFVWNGNYIIATFDGADDSLKKTYLRVGSELIAETNANGTFFAIYAANKNITGYIDTNGNNVASYDYNPFGGFASKTGSNADDFDFTFSSEYLDKETNLYAYKYRYYSPELGRWLTRDPIGEKGGYNLYGMVGNDAIGKWDYLGQKWKIFRNSENPWAQVCRETRRDTVANLARKIKLRVGDAFGINGWLKGRNGSSRYNIERNEVDLNNNYTLRRQFWIPNTFVVQRTTGVSLTLAEEQVSKRLESYNYHVVNKLTTGSPEVFGVIFMGHFDTGTSIGSGHFKPGGSSLFIGPGQMKNAVGHKIAFFAGVGCNSSRGIWTSAVAYLGTEITSQTTSSTVWVTYYPLTPTLFRTNIMSVQPISTDTKKIRTGTDGTKFGEWLTGTKLN